MTKTGSRRRTVSDRKHNNISFQRKENRLLDPNQQKFDPNKEQAPRAKRSRTHTLILGFKQKPGSQSRSKGPGPYTPNNFFRKKTASRRGAVPAPLVYSYYKESLQCTDASLSMAEYFTGRFTMR